MPAAERLRRLQIGGILTGKREPFARRTGSRSEEGGVGLGKGLTAKNKRGVTPPDGSLTARARKSSSEGEALDFSPS